MTILTIHDLTVCYQKRAALQGCCLSFDGGESVALIGPNGAGKSSLLKAMVGLVPSSKGLIEIDPSATLAYLPQRSEVDLGIPMTVFEFLSMAQMVQGSLLKGVYQDAKIAINKALEVVKLSGREEYLLSELSGGQFQRVLFARLLLQDADIILLDEPFTGIDIYTIDLLCELITEWKSAGKLVIAVLHDLYLAKRYFEKSVILACGVIARGDTKTVLTDENVRKAYDKMARRGESGC